MLCVADIVKEMVYGSCKFNAYRIWVFPSMLACHVKVHFLPLACCQLKDSTWVWERQKAVCSTQGFWVMCTSPFKYIHILECCFEFAGLNDNMLLTVGCFWFYLCTASPDVLTGIYGGYEFRTVFL